MSVNLRQFVRYLRPHWALVGKAFFLLALSVLLSLPLPLLSMYLIDVVVKVKDFSTLNLIGTSLIGAFFLRAVASVFQRFLSARFRTKVLFDIRKELLDHLLTLDMRFFKDHGTGYLVSRVHSDPQALQGLMADAILGIIRDVLTVMVGMVALFWIHPKLALFSVSLIPIFCFSVFTFHSRLRQMNKDLREAMAQLQRQLQESISGMETIKIFCWEQKVSERIAASLKRVLNMDIRYSVVSALNGSVSSAFFSAASLAVVWYGVAEIMHGHLTLGGLVAFDSFLGYLFGPSERLVSMNINLQSVFGAMDRVFEILDLTPGIKDKQGAVPLIVKKGSIEFCEVTFSYDRGVKILDRVSFFIRPGETVALVGLSGAGKTTVANLIMRLYEPERGEILIDGIDIRDVTLQSLRENIGYVTQEPFLFKARLEENIRFGNGEVERAKVIEAAERAGIHDFIASLPDGYKTEVGERGVNLSSGQKQRIALARVILRDPKILILDEATSSLDANTERFVHQTIRDLMRGRTCLIIAHRLWTAVHAHRILVLDRGHLVAEGTHAELYRRCPLYAALCDHQFHAPGTGG